MPLRFLSPQEGMLPRLRRPPGSGIRSAPASRKRLLAREAHWRLGVHRRCARSSARGHRRGFSKHCRRAFQATSLRVLIPIGWGLRKRKWRSNIGESNR